MNQNTKENIIQEMEYTFPYHFIPFFDKGVFKQCRNFSWGFEYLSYLNFVVSNIEKVKCDSLLDVGCGDGRLIYELNRRLPERKIRGMDYFQKAIDLAKAMHPQGNYVCGDITGESLFESKFDIITAIETLEHIKIKDLTEFIRKTSEYLNPDGRFIITVPSINVRLNKKHFQHFSLESFKSFIPEELKLNKYHYINIIEKNIRYRILKKILTNDFFILNNNRLLNKIFQYYTKKLFFCEKYNCRRIYVELIKIN